MLGTIVLFLAGAAIDLPFLLGYIANRGRLESISYPAIFGLLLIVLAVQLFGFTLLLELLRKVQPGKPQG
jgi:hypothetical protein